MRKMRTFTSQFKGEVVEELLSRTTAPAQLARRYNLSSGLLYHWKKQQACSDYVKELLGYGFKISMARRGNPYENAVCESFIKTLKDEELYLWEYRTIEDAERKICYFVKDVYNERRLHSSLGYCPPNEFEERSLNKQKPTVSSQITLT